MLENSNCEIITLSNPAEAVLRLKFQRRLKLHLISGFLTASNLLLEVSSSPLAALKIFEKGSSCFAFRFMEATSYSFDFPC